MNIPFIKITFPVSPYYYSEDVNYKSLYFNFNKNGKSPSKEEVIKVLDTLHIDYPQYVMYRNTWIECIASVNNCEEWRVLSLHDSFVCINTFTQTVYFKGRKPLSFEIIKPLSI